MINDTGERIIPDIINPKQEVASFIRSIHLDRYRNACINAQQNYVLDIACGTGYGSHMLAQAGAKHVFSADISEESINYAKRRYAHENISYFAMDFLQACSYLEELGVSVDIICCYDTLQHLPDSNVALMALQKLLSTNGVAYISVNLSPSKGTYKWFLQDYTVEKIYSELNRAGFKVTSEAAYTKKFKPRAVRQASIAYSKSIPKLPTGLRPKLEWIYKQLRAALVTGVTFDNLVLTCVKMEVQASPV